MRLSRITPLIIAVFSILFFLNSGARAAQDNFTPKEKVFLLNLARQALYWYLEDRSVPEVDRKYLTPNLLEKKACFVTLNGENGELRGCIGMFEPVDTPLYANVINRAIASVTQDSRFFSHPVTYNELGQITIEISILISPQRLDFSSPQDLLSKLRPFVDGVILTTPYGGSTYLPQVWDQLPGREDFLSSLCEKHGAPGDYWKTNPRNLGVQVYEVIHFSEAKPAGKVVGKRGAIVGEGGGTVLGRVFTLGQGQENGAYPVKEGQFLEPATIVTAQTVLKTK